MLRKKAGALHGPSLLPGLLSQRPPLYQGIDQTRL